jgi:putative ABC transport system ATP-binding protein
MITIKNLYITFNQKQADEFTALKDINLHVKPNELIILKGVSGSGKSTLLSIIATLIKPTSGNVIVNGKQVAKLPDLHAAKFRSNDIGFIFQSFNLFDSLSVSENVALPLITTELTQKEIDQKTDDALYLANISHKKDQKVKNLSGGEKQRTAIARALVNDPKIILCDEPTANLDSKNSISFLQTITKLKMLGKTIIIATHDPIFDTLKSVDRIVDIKDGKLI